MKRITYANIHGQVGKYRTLIVDDNVADQIVSDCSTYPAASSNNIVVEVGDWNKAMTIIYSNTLSGAEVFREVKKFKMI